MPTYRRSRGTRTRRLPTSSTRKYLYFCCRSFAVFSWVLAADLHQFVHRLVRSALVCRVSVFSRLSLCFDGFCRRVCSTTRATVHGRSVDRYAPQNAGRCT